MGRPRLYVPDRLLRYRSIDPDDGCWNWNGAAKRTGYGVMGIDGRQWLVHRVAWTIWRGDIPKGMQVLHRCDNPRCFNPDHLFLGDHAENMRDRNGKIRHASGSRHGMSKLTDADVEAIRASDLRNPDLAERFGVSTWTISRIRNRRSWR